MAKFAFSKLGLKVDDVTDSLLWGENTIEVKRYLPLNDKLTLVQTILNETVDENGYYNPIQLDVYTVIEVTMAYTNLSFTDKQKEDPQKLYDLLVSSGFWAMLKQTIAKMEFEYIEGKTKELIDNIYKYRNSAVGIMENMNMDYSNLAELSSQIENSLQNKENIGLVKDILDKMG